MALSLERNRQYVDRSVQPVVSISRRRNLSRAASAAPANDPTSSLFPSVSPAQRAQLSVIVTTARVVSQERPSGQMEKS